MVRRFEPWIPAARPMTPVAGQQWFATARIRQLDAARDDAYIRLRGEWHGRTAAEAEAKARRAAEEWIASRTGP